MKTIRDEIQELENQKAALDEKIEKLQAEKKQLDSIGPEAELATLLHTRLCRSSHIDQCGWEYEKIEDFIRRGSTRFRYLEYIKKILETCTIEEVKKVLTAMINMY